MITVVQLGLPGLYWDHNIYIMSEWRVSPWLELDYRHLHTYVYMYYGHFVSH